MPSTRIELTAGDVIFREGDAPTTAFLIEEGEVEILTSQGDEIVVLGRLGPGDLLGEMAVIDSSPRTATACAISRCVMTAVGREQLHERLAGADPIVRALLRGQLQRYRSALATLRGEGERAHDVHPEREADLDAGAIGKIRLETQLREALANRALEVRFQPILEIARNRIAGYEALIRWDHPERGPISPAEFIALAEETSLILPVGVYVFERVCEAVAPLVRSGATDPPFVAVNVSSRQLEADTLLEEVVAIAAKAGVPPSVLKIEITESLTLDLVRVAALIERAHAHGMQVALDDFGTGYSNLGHLHKLRFDTVKLDQGFVRQMLHDARSEAIVRAIVAMVRALDADLVAEGVETPEQLAALGKMGARYAQGWLIGRPAPAESLAETFAASP